VLNNPLSFTDPTGFSWWTQWRRPIFAIAAATLLGGLDFPALLQGQWVFQLGSNGFIGAIAGGFAGGGIQGGNLESAVYGALTAGAFYGVGTLANAHGLEIGDFLQPNHLAAIAGHAAVGCASAAAQGGSCKSGALSAGFSELVGPVLPDQKQFAIAGLIASAVAGGAGAALGGGKFQNGAVTGAFGYLFNEVGHLGQRGYEPTFYPDGTVCNAPTACSNWSGAVESSYPEMLLVGGLSIKAGQGMLALLATDGTVLAEREVAQVTLNRLAGNAFRDEIAGLLSQAGYQVETEVSKWTIFGRRFIDIDVWKNGVNLGGIETKFSGGVYSAAQQAKDAWLRMSGYIVNVVRGP